MRVGAERRSCSSAASVAMGSTNIPSRPSRCEVRARAIVSGLIHAQRAPPAATTVASETRVSSGCRNAGVNLRKNRDKVRYLANDGAARRRGRTRSSGKNVGNDVGLTPDVVVWDRAAVGAAQGESIGRSARVATHMPSVWTTAPSALGCGASPHSVSSAPVSEHDARNRSDGSARGVSRLRLSAASLALAAASGVFAPAWCDFGVAAAQGVIRAESPFDGRPVGVVRFEGIERVSVQLLRNQLRTREGRPYSEATAQDDVRRLYRLGQFRSVEASLEIDPDDPGAPLTVVFRFVEAPIVEDVQVVGNRRVTDQDLARVVNILPGTPMDEFLLGRSIRAIEELYRNRGFFLVEVTVDERELEESGIVLFRVREGERVRVTGIRFSGNRAFEDRELRPNLRTKTAGILERGPLDNEVLDNDVTSLIRFYQAQGYLDIRADRQITPSPDGREAIVTFVLDEGPLYSLRNVVLRTADAEAESRPPVFTAAQISAIMEIKSGDIYSTQRVERSMEAVRASYWRLGYADARVQRDELRDAEEPLVDIFITVVEGPRFRTGEVLVQGNDLTKQKVIRRHVRLRPDRPLDRGAVRETERRLEASQLFEAGSVRVTVQPERREDPGYRDVLVEVAETDTGSLTFGAAVGSDSGVTGLIGLEQRNFDLFDPPESVGEFFRGQSFRGAGQQFSLALQPGTEVQTYSVSLTEPHLFESDYSLTGQFFFRQRIFRQYDEERFGGRTRIGRRFGDRWVAGLGTRAEWVSLSNINARAPAAIFDDRDRALLTGVSLDMTRTTVPPTERFRPTRGTRVELAVERVGAFGGDYDFTKLRAEHQIFMTVYEDYLGRKGVLSFKTTAQYIPEEGEAPIYERYFLGGRSLRGFEFRTVSPRGLRRDGTPSNEPIGGEWLFFFGTEYEHPVWRDILSVVGFVDTGTVTNEIGFDDYRVSIGSGVRLYLPQLGQAPLAFDFGFPIRTASGDQKSLFSFAVDLPF
ncbi:MAG: outer membrane protein assembly factor BamA [Phycisphaerales bacterium]|nr:MAG: outer membrane protein assembly factor BamA [Phycisphaerales bacterium]